LEQGNYSQSSVENNKKILYDLTMLFLFKFLFFTLLNKYLIYTWIIFTPGIALALEADRKAMEGVEFYQKQKYDQASKRFLEAHKGKPKDPKISYNLGNSSYKEGNYENALQSYSRSLEQGPSPSINQKASYNMGNALFRMNKLEESILAYKKALELDPNDMDSKFNLEFVREQINNRKQNNQEKDKEGQNQGSEKNKTTNDKEENLNKKKENTPPNKNSSNSKNIPNQKKLENNSSQKIETASKEMTRDEAEQRLSTLTEDLKQFQRKQALEMKSLFTYEGNDW
jgi:Ca-activated chloride channel homolog